MDTEWLFGLLEVILINIVLSGDNAVVIAMASRKLPPAQQKKAVFWGTMGAVVLRLVLTFVAVWLLQIPLVGVAGGLLLLYIAMKLLSNEDEHEGDTAAFSMGQAIKTIILADLIMSLDNVVAVAAAAQGDWLLIGIGLALSIPLIIFCSQLLTNLMKRYPIIVWLGAGLLAFTAGEMLENDDILHGFMEEWFPGNFHVLPVLFIVIAVTYGVLSLRGARKRMKENH
ncbi:hypothetical protein SD71_10995 [Cohnella kolymensis]|uniref:Integral membrane protein n=1 Tax=Cohnella kolymensis TaxID=1590652 RepID=A0ABR5A569_9BACL|nr:TerC family protein [Cohnella kolymensis]KIL35903.1 hypothetical protein SD71_10995 [Cohnella kolymensis]